MKYKMCMNIMGATIKGKIYDDYKEAVDARLNLIDVHSRNNLNHIDVYIQPIVCEIIEFDEDAEYWEEAEEMIDAFVFHDDRFMVQEEPVEE